MFQGLSALGVAAALAGCGGSDDPDTGTDTGGGPEATSSGGATTGSSDDGGAGGTELATTAEVPVGGGIILTEERIVITQPTEGDFKAFTAVCTHQQLTVTAVEDGAIRCDNHGSTYDAVTGEVTGGPAPAALAEVPIEVAGDKILAA